MNPPRLADRLLALFCAPRLLEEVQGDLHEEFALQVELLGERKAKWWYWREVLGFLKPRAGRPFAVQRQRGSLYQPFLINSLMVRNYFKIAWRNLIRQKAYASLNIVGLALGLTCSLLILLWVQDERRVDGFHANGHRLYQVYERHYFDGKVEANYFTQGMLAEALKQVVPEVQYASSLEWNTIGTFQAGAKVNKMTGSFAGADFFKMFSYPLLEGTPQGALNTPDGVAISRKMAEQFFGSPQKAIRRTIRYENRENLLVTAVFENIPGHSSQQFDYLRSWVAYVKENEWVHNWGNTNPMTLVQLRSDANTARVEAKIKAFIHRYLPAGKGFRIELGLQPFPEKYLHSSFKNGQLDGGRIEYVRLFTVVAVFILLIACINFMNLATARSAKRAKEVGVRKVVGAARFTLVGQFIGEALLLTFLSIGLALGLVALSIPAFNALTGKQLVLPLTQPIFGVTLLGLLLLTGFVAGSYPALFLSSLNPVQVLKSSRLAFGFGATIFRKGLVVFQFMLSVLLILGMLVVHYQTEYIQTKHLGFDRENLLYLPIEGELVTKYNLLKQEAGKVPGVVAISRMSESPTGIGHHTGNIGWVGKDPNQVISFSNAAVGYDFVKTLKLTLAQGRDFSNAFGTDTASYLLNEAAVRKIGYQNPVGKPLTWGNHPGTIIGVLNDFHFNSMHKAIEPLVVRLDEKQPWGTILVRTEATKTKQALAGLEDVCRRLNPNFPFTYQFSDQAYTSLYRSEEVVSQLANYFAVLAVFISCLGLFGLATFTAEQRTKEIGVRKVLGASVGSILSLLNREFLKLVLLAVLIASPVAWFALTRWLQGFAYHITIQWWMFAAAGLLAVGIALLTVSFQSVKAALANPVKSLRSE